VEKPEQTGDTNTTVIGASSQSSDQQHSATATVDRGSGGRTGEHYVGRLSLARIPFTQIDVMNEPWAYVIGFHGANAHRHAQCCFASEFVNHSIFRIP
jgi:hypothetical protein